MATKALSSRPKPESVSPWKVGVFTGLGSMSTVLLVGLAILWYLESSQTSAPVAMSAPEASAIVESEPAANASNESQPVEIQPPPETTIAVEPITTDVVESPESIEDPAVEQEVSASNIVKLYRLERPRFHAAYDPATGHLLVTEQMENQVTLYDLNQGLEKVVTTPGPSRPTVAFAKQFRDKSFFLVGSKLEKRIDVLDARDGNRIESIGVQGNVVLHFSASRDADDPYVYYTIVGLDGDAPQVGRINLEQLTDEGFLGVEATEFEVSATGDLAYSRTAFSSPTGFHSYRLVERDPLQRHDVEFRYCPTTVEPVHDEHQSTTGYTPGPHGVYVVAGDRLYNASAKEILGTFEFEPLCFLPKTPWVFGLKDGALFVGSVNDGRTVAQAQLSATFAPRQEEHEPSRMREDYGLDTSERMHPIFVDESRSRVIVASADQVAVVPLEALRLPDEPLLAVGISQRTSVYVGDEVSVPFESFDERVSTRIHLLPDGMDFRDNTLHWSPKSSDIGTAAVIVERRYGNWRLEQPIEFSVARRSLMLPLVAKAVSLSPDGRLAVVWGDSINTWANDVETEGPNLAVVAVDQRRLVAAKLLEKPIQLACLDGRAVHVLTQPTQGAGPDSQTDVLTLGVDDLSLLKVSKASGTDAILRIVADRFLLASRDRFDLSNMRKIVAEAPQAINGQIHMQPVPNRPVQQLSDGWYFDGTVWNDDLTQARILFHPADFGSSSYYTNTSMAQAVPTDWGRTFQADGIGQYGGKLIVGFRGSPTIITPTLPAVITLLPEGRGDARVSSLQVRELAGGQETQQIILARGEPARSFRPADIRGTALDVAEDTIAVCSGGRLYFVHLSEVNRSLLIEPFRFRLEQSTIDLGRGSSAPVRYKLIGGTGPYEVTFRLGNFEQLETADDWATFAIPGRDIALAAEQTFVNHNQWSRRQREVDTRTFVLDYIDAVTPAFRRLVGRAPNGVPIPIQATLEALDHDLATASLQHFFLAEIPQARAVKLLNDPPDFRTYQPAPVVRTRPRRREEESKRASQIAEINARLAIEYADGLRDKYPSESVDDAELKQNTAKAVRAANAFLNRHFGQSRAAKLRESRTWRDHKGRAVEAKLTAAFADEVTLLLSSGKEVTVPMERLSAEDQKLVRGEAPVTIEEQVTTKMSLLAEGFDRHMRRESSYPPAFLVSSSGRPLLSWRVALLPYIGGENLLKLFHLDEPWNSSHNIKLLEAIPDVYADGELPVGRTRYLGFRASNAILADGHPVTRRECTAGTNEILLITEVSADHALEWTRPDDIDEEQFHRLAEILQERNGTVNVVVASGLLRHVPTGTPNAQWKNAVNRDHRPATGIEWNSPSAANDRKPPRSPLAKIADERPLGRPRTSVTDLHVDENSPIGTVVGQATGAPRGYFYAIESGNFGEAFAIDPTTGVISVQESRMLDAEQTPSFLLRIVAINSRGERVPVQVTMNSR